MQDFLATREKIQFPVENGLSSLCAQIHGQTVPQGFGIAQRAPLRSLYALDAIGGTDEALEDQLLPFSSKTGEGREDLLESLESLLSEA